MIRGIVTFLMVYLFWILMTFSLAAEELIAGAAVSVLVTYLTYEFLFTKTRGRALNPFRWLYSLVYLAVFVWEEVKSHLDLSYRIITGRINPGIVKVNFDMDTDIGKTMIANSITLTPGTLAVRINGKSLFIHCISYRAGDKPGKSFEKYAQHIFEHKDKWVK